MCQKQPSNPNMATWDEKRLDAFWELVLKTRLFTGAILYFDSVIKNQRTFRTPGVAVPAVPATLWGRRRAALRLLLQRGERETRRAGNTGSGGRWRG